MSQALPSRLVAPLVVFAAVTALLLAIRPSSSPAPDVNLDGSPVVAEGDAADVGPSAGLATLDTEAQIASYQHLLRARPETAAYAGLGDAYYQRARETGDPAFYSRAQRAFELALAREPEDVDATVGLGTLALARHDFAGGLALGQRAHRLEPGLARPYTVIADGQIELGRYAAAAATIDRLVRLKPTLAAYTRVSYFRELEGDLGGAVQAMRLAASAGGSVEGTAYVNVLVGGLEFDRGNYGAADHAYREALARDHRYPPAIAGRAKVAAADGRPRRGDPGLPAGGCAAAAPRIRHRPRRNRAGRRHRMPPLPGIWPWSKRRRSCSKPAASTQASSRRCSGRTTAARRRQSAAGRASLARAPSVPLRRRLLMGPLHASGRTQAAERYSEKAIRLGSRTRSSSTTPGMIALAAGRNGRAQAYLGS